MTINNQKKNQAGSVKNKQPAKKKAVSNPVVKATGQKQKSNNESVLPYTDNPVRLDPHKLEKHLNEGENMFFHLAEAARSGLRIWQSFSNH